MSTVSVPYGDNPGETATLLLAAVEEIDGLEAGVVVADPGNGTFTVLEEVAKKAGLEPVDLDAELNAAVEEAKKTPELPSEPVTRDSAEAKAMAAEAEANAADAPQPVKKAPAKKAAAKKTTARKTAAKKSTAKKSTAKKAS